MQTKTKWAIGIVLASIIGLLLWIVFHKGQDLNSALDNIRSANEKIDNLKVKMDSTIRLNQSIINSNQSFQRVIESIDSVTKKRDQEAKVREQKLLRQLDEVTTNITQLKKQLESTSESLPLPPVRTLDTTQ